MFLGFSASQNELAHRRKKLKRGKEKKRNINYSRKAIRKNEKQFKRTDAK
jgi:hypothetical protein